MTFATERIRKDLEGLVLPEWITVVRKEDLLLEFQFNITSGPYSYQTVNLIIRFPMAFPFDSPKLELVGNVREMHPFVDPTTGAVCMDILRLGWRPTIGIDTLVYGTALMLQEPLSLYDKDSVVLNEKALMKLKRSFLH